MTSSEFTRSLKLLGLTVEEFGEEFGVSRRTAYRYASGETPVPEPVAMLLQARVNEPPAGNYNFVPKWHYRMSTTHPVTPHIDCGSAGTVYPTTRVVGQTLRPSETAEVADECAV